ncbi:hypothetical protein G6F24_015264 [Rhizopus arrhizus]|nr:hypothetical protein G6F24_015264 [Rhizopus arrhizus]
MCGAAIDVPVLPHVRRGVLDAALDLAGHDGAEDVGAGGGDAPVGGDTADAGAAVDHVVGFAGGGIGPAHVGHRQPVGFDFRLPARHRRGDAGHRTTAVAGRPDLDQRGAGLVAAAGIDAAVHVVAITDRRILRVQRGSGHVAGGDAPAVVDGAHALRLDLRIHVQRGGIIRIGAVQRTRAIEIVRVQAPLVIGITEDAGSGQVRTEGHAVHALAITLKP